MVTGDAVILDVQIAQLPVRAIGEVIDITVMSIAYMLGLVLSRHGVPPVRPGVSAAVLIIFTVLALVGYPVVSRSPPAAGRSERWRWACGWCPMTAVRNGSAKRCFARWPRWSRSGCSSAVRQ